jgi:hypothetical protein
MSSKKVVLSGAIVIACVGALKAQQYYDRGGTAVQGVVPSPYSYAPLGPGQHNLAPTSSTALTIPPGVKYATICASTATVRYTTDGLTMPTPTIGQPLVAGSCVMLSGAQVLSSFRAASASGTLDIEYFQ